MTRLGFALVLLSSGAGLAFAEVDYERDIKELLAEKCTACHGVLKQEAGLRLDAGQLILEGSAEGPVIDRAAPGDSLLVQRVSASDPAERMPPEDAGKPLTTDQIQLLTQWIRAGASYPATEQVRSRPEQHWAYQPPRKVELPDNGPPAWSANPIDALVFEQYKSLGLEPAPLAEQRTLLRRVYFDLIGLPPTRQEQQQFLSGELGSWSSVVDRLLDDSAYGERWGRHWMDVWRYSDWDGYKNSLRGSQRHIWHWRDWIIESLNQDKGYDQMVVQMLAGDELAPEDPDTLRATGFLVRSFHHSNRNIWLDATVEHSAKALLGMTLNCARCHDHKYDPLSQREYYAWRAIFEPHHVRTERLPGEADLIKQGLPRAFDAEPEAPTYVYLQGNEKLPDKEHPVTPNVPGIIDLPFDVRPIELPTAAVYPSLREFIEQEDLAAAEQRLATASKQLAASETKPAEADKLALNRQKRVAAERSLESLRARWQADKARRDGRPTQTLARQAATAERAAKLAQAELAVLENEQALASAKASTEKVASKKQAAIDAAQKKLDTSGQKLNTIRRAAKKQDDEYTSIGETYPQISTGRRLALAHWITDPANPLTARVAVNHVWLRHFGQPLVENVFDFGLRSPPPQQQRLLDWLAVELIEHQWSMKHLHRLIVTSRTYQLASSVGEQHAHQQSIDPENKLLWRANIRRLDAEVVRDSLLAIAGNLDRTIGGPDIDFVRGQTVRRRSVYFRHAYEKQMPMMLVFDAASPTECYRRSESIIPQQALALANSPLAIDQARALAAKLSTAADDFIGAAFETVLGRTCTATERTTCEQFLEIQAERLSEPSNLTTMVSTVKGQSQPSADNRQRAKENLVHVLINHNDFVTVR